MTPSISPRGIALDPCGRLMASADDDGVRLWDLGTTRQLVKLPAANCCAVWFHPDGTGLIAAGTDGLQMWTIHQGNDGELSIGPAQRLCPPLYAPTYASFSANGRFVAFTSGGSHVLMRDLEMGTSIAWGGHHNLHTVAISPQGKWVAAYPGPGIKIWNTTNGKLQTTLLSEVASGWNRLVFSPDRNWLVSGRSNEYRFWHVGDWAPGHRVNREGHPIGGPIAFTCDGRLAAIASSRYEAKLIDPATGKELATLEAPGALPDIADFCFSPDGTRLVTSGANRVVHVWDLQRIRRRFGEMELDWNLPVDPDAFGPVSKDSPHAIHITQRNADGTTNSTSVAPGKSRPAEAPDAGSLIDQLQDDDWRKRLQAANALIGLDNKESTVAAITQRLSDAATSDETRCRLCRVLAEIGVIDSPTQTLLSHLAKSNDSDVRAWTAVTLARAGAGPDNAPALLTEPSDDRERTLRNSIASAWNGRTWSVVLKPGQAAAEYDRAVRLARAAQRLLPESGVVLNTLGVALYRAGQWEESRALLNRSKELNVARFGGPIPSDVAFLAMVHQRLGESAKSTSYYQQLLDLVRRQPWLRDSETKRLVSEARAMFETDK